MKLKPGLSEVYGEGGGLRHHGGEASEQQFGVGIVGCFHVLPLFSLTISQNPILPLREI